MLNRICVLFLALVVALPVLADEDDWDNVAETAAPVQAEPAAEPPTETAAAPAAESVPVAEPTPAAESTPAPEASAKPAEKKEDPFAKLEAAKTSADTTPKPAVGREVPVRYWVMGDSVEQEAIFVKIERDTVYLKRPNADEQKNLEKLQEQTIAAMEESNGQHQEEEEDEESESAATPAPAAPVAVADTTPAEQEQPQEQAQEADDGADDERQEDEVALALDAQGRARVGRVHELECLLALGALAGDVAPVDEDEDDHEQRRVQDEQRPDVLQRPEERHAAQVAQEQRRVAERGEAPAHVGHEEDEEDHDVRAVLAPHVRAQHGADEQHRGAGRAHPACQRRADEQQDHVVARCADDSASDMDAAGDDKQAQEQDDEGDVVSNDGFRQLFGGDFRAEPDNERNEENCCPENCNVKFVGFPPLTLDKRKDCNGKQHAHEGNDAPKRQHMTKFHNSTPECRDA